MENPFALGADFVENFLMPTEEVGWDRVSLSGLGDLLRLGWLLPGQIFKATAPGTERTTSGRPIFVPGYSGSAPSYACLLKDFVRVVGAA